LKCRTGRTEAGRWRLTLSGWFVGTLHDRSLRLSDRRILPIALHDVQPFSTSRTGFLVPFHSTFLVCYRAVFPQRNRSDAPLQRGCRGRPQLREVHTGEYPTSAPLRSIGYAGTEDGGGSTCARTEDTVPRQMECLTVGQCGSSTSTQKQRTYLQAHRCSASSVGRRDPEHGVIPLFWQSCPGTEVCFFPSWRRR
jgi:hypothetical protein